jgi:crotonobetaine/carnitine-CoA ligase
VSTPLQDRTTLTDAWNRSVESRSNEVFLIFEGSDGATTEWTYGEFDEKVGNVAALLVDAGVVQGSSVHLALTNCPTFVAVWIATNRLGGWIVPSDPMGRTPELADHIERTTPIVGFCSTNRSEVYRGAAGSTMAVIEVDEDEVDFAAFPTTRWTDWANPEPQDRAAVVFTSGTTGKPKGVVITQANYAFAGRVMAESAALQPADRQLVVLPLFHVNAQYYSFASAIWAGASVALMHTFSASGFLPQAARHNATCASLFAAPIRMILTRGGPTSGLSLRHCWFAQNISDDQYETFSDWLGCRPRQLYGMTETIPAVLTDRADDPRADSMGFVTPRCDVDVHDADGNAAPDGEVGELVVRGRQGRELFAEYLDDPATTKASFRNRWFLTGDRARREADGRFFFDGRRSDVLKVAGENVSTVEVEAVLCAHPRILEASVVGAPDEIRDEVPVAFVVPIDVDQPPSADELTRWCADRLAKVKVPRDITFLDELPRTSVGKIRKFILKNQVES